MAELISLADLPPEVAAAHIAHWMVDSANGQAYRAAPVLAGTPTTAQRDEARLVVIGAVTRWAEQAPTPVTQQTAGPFSTTTVVTRSGYRLWPSEVQQLGHLSRCHRATPVRRRHRTRVSRWTARPVLRLFFATDVVGYRCSCGRG